MNFSSQTSPNTRLSTNSFIGALVCPLQLLLQFYNMSVLASKLKDNARPVQNADPAAICSAADARLTVYQTVDLAKKFWCDFTNPLYMFLGLLTRFEKYRVKGKNFSISTLLNVPEDSEKALSLDGAGLAIFRLAPADYHRFHSPIDGEVGEIVHIPGQYYTGKAYFQIQAIVANFEFYIKS
jgi:phosphatidylserine decarboxylase